MDQDLGQRDHPHVQVEAQDIGQHEAQGHDGQVSQQHQLARKAVVFKYRTNFLVHKILKTNNVKNRPKLHQTIIRTNFEQKLSQRYKH